jgi:hypothetical protein
MSKGKWLFMRGCKLSSTIFTATKFLKFYQEGENVLMSFASRLKGNDIPMQYMNYIYCCNYFSFYVFDLGHPVYCTCLMYHSRYLQKQVRCSPMSQQVHVPVMLTTVGVLAVLTKCTKCGNKKH